jgi:hypothetical protein
MPLSDLAVAGSFASHAIRHPLDFYSSVGPTLNELTFGLLGASFDPRRNITDSSGKVIFVTGGELHWRRTASFRGSPMIAMIADFISL